MRGAPAWHRPHSVQHPSSVSALRADPPSPTRAEGKEALTSAPCHRPRTDKSSPDPASRRA
ncbi:hypothetical protein CIT26_03540 [Mesorhizobium temperatum]|uniref:Uncharacterized protein n=1 Tax=Mesorhizobium temperatum TaxID=241416 RepID=A0A271LW67_9HYPH|nr:hypothetical protein CIT26_03540 [Mesorhizobium temperatum]